MSWVSWQTTELNGWTLRSLTQTPLTKEEAQKIISRMEAALSTLPPRKGGTWVSKGCFGSEDTGQLWYIFVGPNGMILCDKQAIIDEMWSETCRGSDLEPAQGILRTGGSARSE